MQDTLDSDVGKRVQRLAKKLGFRWVRAPWPGFTPGRGHHASVAGDLLHEVAHYIVAPQWRKNRAYFGLGEPACSLTALIAEKNLQPEEELASLLGIGLLYEFGGKYKLMLDNHGWYGDHEDLKQTTTKLVERGLMKKSTAEALKRELKLEERRSRRTKRRYFTAPRF